MGKLTISTAMFNSYVTNYQGEVCRSDLDYDPKPGSAKQGKPAAFQMVSQLKTEGLVLPRFAKFKPAQIGGIEYLDVFGGYV